MLRIFLAVICAVSTCIGEDHSRTSNQNNSGLFEPEVPIPVAATVGRGQIGRGEVPHGDKRSPLHSSIPRGTADIFGNGPYDLFVDPQRLFPFQGFNDKGVPQYGSPLSTKGANNHDVFTGPNGVVYGVKAAGRQVFLSRFSKRNLTFESVISSEQLNVPGGMGGATAYVDSQGRFNVYATINSQGEYRPEGDHHSAEYMPYDGAGFWRGKIPRRALYHIQFQSLKLNAPISVSRVGEGPGQFLFSVRTLTVARFGKSRPAAIISTEKQAVLRSFEINESTGQPGHQRFVNDEQHVALRHSAINASVKAITNPETQQSDLIVGDSGRLWHYRFLNEFSPNGSPVYGAPAPVLSEGAPLALGNLPVVTPGDVDTDGLVDLIAGNNAGDLLFVKNIGKKDRPEFDNPVRVPVGGWPLDIKAGYRGSIQGPGEAMWGYTCPTLCDWDGDGRLDIILNSIMADYMFLQQVPSDNGPAFSRPQAMYCDGLQLHLAWRCQPAITNWGTEDRLCMIVLDEQNLLRRFWRIDNNNVERGKLLRLHDGNAITANVDEAAGQTGRAKLVATDWDQDGDIDLLIGASRGLSFPASENTYLPSAYGAERQASVMLLRNVGTNEDPRFDYVRLLQYDGQRIGLGIHSCSPAPVDLGRGKVDLLVGEESGSIRYFPRDSLSVSTTAPPQPVSTEASPQ